MCERKSSWWLFALLLLVLFFSARTVWADETSAPATPPPLQPSSQSGQTTSSTPTDPWSNLDSAWLSLKGELTGSQSDSEALSILLLGLQTEANELRFSLQESTKRYEESEAARMTEREACIEREAGIVERLWSAERSRAAWRTGALIGVSAAALEAVIIIVSLIIGG